MLCGVAVPAESRKHARTCSTEDELAFSSDETDAAGSEKRRKIVVAPQNETQARDDSSSVTDSFDRFGRDPALRSLAKSGDSSSGRGSSAEGAGSNGSTVSGGSGDDGDVVASVPLRGLGELYLVQAPRPPITKQPPQNTSPGMELQPQPQTRLAEAPSDTLLRLLTAENAEAGAGVASAPSSPLVSPERN
eukprot:COSAG05_NODE_832_length_7073_cov_4.937482_3_plen_191_part_00